MEKRGRKKARYGLSAAVCCIALAASAANMAAAEEAPADAPSGVVKEVSKDGVTVTLSTDKASYSAGEEIHYTISIENGKGLAYLKGAKITYSSTKGLSPASEDSMPGSFPDIQPGETVALNGVLIGDEAVLAETVRMAANTAGAGTSAAETDAAGADAPGTDVPGTDASGTDAAETGAAGTDAAGTEPSGAAKLAPVLAGIAGTALLAVLILLSVRRARQKNAGKNTGKDAGMLALLLGFCLAAEALPVQAAAESVTLRPYATFEYAGMEVMIRMVMEFRMVQNRWEVAAADRAQNKQITCHDPSIFRDKDGVYYVLGTHITGGRSTNLYDWVSLDPVLKESYSPETRKQIREWNEEPGGVNWFGYLWAPDIIYNPAMEKYCVYLSANGDNWKSNIVMLTADYVTGPYEYAGSVVYGGFNAETFAETDAPKALGTKEIPERYVKNGVGNKKWGDMWPNCIDPCVFYAEDGRLMMAYGSWSGGIFLLELDEKTGLRDYNVKYDTNIHSDAYFGKKIAGGSYVSGEGSYIQRIGDYYYLFVSYGNLEAAGGYNVRVFRSESPDGDYVDALGNTPFYDKYAFNYNQSVGVRLMGGYQWRNFSVGQVAQGHNSAFVDKDGRAYMAFHTRTTNGTEGHYVKVHQLFVTKEGWLAAAPYLTHGEKLREEGYSAAEAAGDYEIILHEMEIDYKLLEAKKPSLITLQEDGSITGEYSGSWSLEAGTPYIALSIEGVDYSGVMLEMEVEGTSLKTMVFTALGDANQLALWGSRRIQ